jgi:DNA-binding CsgD family transcriptional regulator
MSVRAKEAALVGREAELERVDGFLTGAEVGPVVLVLDGEAGIGKTRVWQEGLRRAADRGHRALLCRPAESEAQLAFAALSDLLADVLEETLPELPEPQRCALEVALLLADPGDRPVDQRAVAAGFLSAVRELADSQPLVVAVDDVQWLDSSSAAALEFILRRLRDERIGLLLTLRSSGEAEAPLGLERALPAERLTRLRLGPLSLGALQRLLREALGTAYPRRTLQRLLEASGGNPFFALELGRAFESSGGRLGEEVALPLSRRLDELLSARVAGLPPSVREVLALAALAADPSVSLLDSASRRDVAPSIRFAAEAGVVSVEQGRVRFTHPLLASACLAHLDDERRRLLHRRLAEAIESSEERARHLALAAGGPDSELASLVEEAAQASLARGAWLAAVDLLEHARRLTAPPERGSWARRSTLLADVLLNHGEVGSAVSVAEEVVEGADPGPERALSLALSAFAVPTELARFGPAFTEAGDNRALRARIGLMEAATRSQTGDFRGRAARLDEALEDARAAGDPELLVQALTSTAQSLMWLNEPGAHAFERAHAHLLEALALEESVSAPRASLTVWTPKTSLAYYATHSEDLDGASGLFAAQCARAAEYGDDGSLSGILLLWADAERLRGNFRRTLELSSESYEIAERSGDRFGQVEALTHIALAKSILGPLDEARGTLAQALASAADIGVEVYIVLGRAAAAVIESCVGDYTAVLREVGTLPEELDAFGSRDPASKLRLASGDEIEARIALGALGAARMRIEELETRSRVLREPRPLAIGLRGRGLLLAAEGNLQGGLDAFEASLAELHAIEAPFERARTLLALGTVQRRAKQRRAARESLQKAIAILEELGADPWAEKARAELARIGGRASASGALTPSEERVAALVAEGKTNREVAAALFVTERTVEGHLTRIYRKLGVRSRTELARRLAVPSAQHA